MLFIYKFYFCLYNNYYEKQINYGSMMIIFGKCFFLYLNRYYFQKTLHTTLFMSPVWAEGTRKERISYNGLYLIQFFEI